MFASRLNDTLRFALLAMLLSAVTAAATVPPGARAAGDGQLQRVEFAKLAAAGSFDNLALREDGRYLALADEAAGVVEVWDVARNASRATLKTPDPRFLLWRGGTLFVANYAEGTISTFTGDALNPGRTLPAGAKNVCFLSAAEGKAFDGTLLATCNTIGGSTIYGVPAGEGGAPRVCGNLNNGIAIVTPDGKRVIEQTFFLTNSSQLSAYDAAAYLSGRKGQKVPVPDLRGTMFTMDVTGACQPFWFAHGRGYFAEQPARTGEMSLLIPDITRDVTCRLSPQFLQPLARDSQPMGFFPLVLPPSMAARLSARQAFAYDRHAIGATTARAERFCQSVAATVDGRMHVFVYCPTDRAVYAADFTTAAELPAAPPRPHLVVVTEGDLPAGRDAFEKAPVPAKSILSMTLSEDGRYLIAAQFRENHVLVWDVVTGKLVHKLDVPQPLFVLVRRNVIYVSCQGRHAIAAYALADGCRHVRDYAGAAGSGHSLTAPAARAFEGTILIGGGSAVYALDIQSGKERVLRQRPYLGDVNVDVAGTQVIESEGLNPPRCRILSYPDYVKGAFPRIDHDQSGSSSRLFQARPHGPWFNMSGELFSAERLDILGIHPSQDWHVAVPDQSADHFYALGFGKVSWRRADPSLQEFASRQAAMPAAPPRAPAILGRADPGWPDAGFTPPLAVTLGKTVYIFVIDGTGTLYRYQTDAATDRASSVASATGTPAGAPAGGFPARVVEGKPVRAHLDAGKPNATFTLVMAPPAMQIDARGNIRWTPGREDVGTVDIKIRVDVGGDVSFQRYHVEVVAAALAANGVDDLAAVAEPGTHYVTGRECYIGLTAARDGVLVLDETSLSILDANGLAVVRRATLPSVYRKLIERTDHWLAMADKSVDVLDKNTFAVRRHIPVEADRLLDIIADPVRPIVYVTRSTNTNVLVQGMSTLVEVDERKWKARVVPGVYADRVAVDPSGRYAFATVGSASALGGTAKDWKRPSKVEVSNMFRGGVVAYDVSHDWQPLAADFRDCFGAAGDMSGTGLSLSSNGRLLVGIALADPTADKLLAFGVGDLRHPKAGYAIDRPYDFSFHPALPLIATSNDERVLVFDHDSGDVSERRVDFGNEKLGEFRHVLFTPGGRHLLVHCRTALGRWVVRTFPLNLAEPERQAIATAMRPPTRKPPAPVPITPLVQRRVAARELEAMAAGPQGPEMTAAAIGRKSIPAVVLIESKEGVGTGFFIGSGGYVLTCAHVLPSVGDATVRFRTLANAKELSRTATVIAADSDNDLALLKIDVPAKVAIVRLSRGADLLAGEPVTVIGNPGLGRTVLQSTLTTGVVSNTDRAIIRHSFIQTSAPINPGNSGGPMFDSHGEVIGVVVLKAILVENTAFAVPPSRIRPFLKDLTEATK